jgi:hypothetical protein
MTMMKRWSRWVVWGMVWCVALVWSVWSFGALYFDFPVYQEVAALIFALVLLVGVVLQRGWKKVGVMGVGSGAVLVWWLTLKPSNEGDWQPDVERTAWAEIRGDEVLLHQVRNCDYRTETDYTPRWENRHVRLSKMTGMDLAAAYWGSPWMAHPVVSFQFSDAPPICFSIETRKKKGQSYSAIGGLYRQFPLIYVVADERDVIRLRSNFREGEELYLYRTTATPEQARQRFLEYLHTLNQLHQEPRWYHALSTNCTTSIRSQRAASKRASWDWRLLVNGKGDELLYERKAVVTDGLNFPELKKRALINRQARAANDAVDFSKRIREGRPGF